MTDIPENLIPADQAEYEMMEVWAGKRKPKDLCIELAVRVVQLTGIVLAALKSLSLGMDGTKNGPPFPPEPDVVETVPSVSDSHLDADPMRA